MQRSPAPSEISSVRQVYVQVKQIITVGSSFNTFIKITLIHIKFISVFEFHVISVHCSIFNCGARGGGFFQYCLNLCEFTWSVLSVFKYYAFLKFILLSWIAYSSVLTWKLSPKTSWYFGNHINFVSSWHLPELGPGAGLSDPDGILWTQYIPWFCEKLASFISCYFLAFYQSLMCSNC